MVDLGCGSGQALIYLARRRPDLRIIGIDLDPSMVQIGNENIRKSDLQNRVELRIGDMTEFTRVVPERVDVVRSMFALHHLPTKQHLEKCIQEIKKVQERWNSSVWIFDHVRPHRLSTAKKFPQIFTPKATPDFKESSKNSLIASWSFEEMKSAIQSLHGKMQSQQAILLPFYQIHWTPTNLESQVAPLWNESRPLPRSAKKEAESLTNLFPNHP